MSSKLRKGASPLFFSKDEFNLPKLEERILEFWEKNKIFEKSLEKTKNGQPFTFYDGPPFATGLPHYGHILASTIKDVIPRYQTMKGRFVRRRWGWDCHGLPIEEIVERKLGISGKKQIEEIGIKKFNETCRSTVMEYVEEWRKMVHRIARWVDFDNSYKTMDRDYMESVWWAFKQIYEKGLVYEGRKVLLYCPRCETPVSNFEVAMDNSYEEVTEEAVTVKFKLKSQISNLKSQTAGDTYLLAWTTTPWTLPGNVALAVDKDIPYIIVEKNGECLLIARERKSAVLGENVKIVQELKGKNLIGLEYETLFDVPAVKRDKVFKVYAADFVNAEEGTGIVHTAVVYGEDDYELGLREGLPVVPLLDEKGIFNDKAPELIRGQYFKDAEKIIKDDLAARNLLFSREMHKHSYPHCWRCGTMLFYNAIPAWFVNIQKIKGDLLKSNDQEINWYPGHLKHGRYEKSVEAAPDWNISRNRYWGNPIPIWRCENCKKHIVAGSIKELGLGTNTFYFSRHGEAMSNVWEINSCHPEKKENDLTGAGVERAKALARKLEELGGVDLIYSSDLLRARRTAEIAASAMSVPINFDERLREYNVGTFNGKSMEEFGAAFPEKERWHKAPAGGETWTNLQKRMVEAVEEINKEHKNKKILIVSHGDPLWTLDRYFGSERGYPEFARPYTMDVSIADLHRPYLDEVLLDCQKCGGKAKRITEIFDSWVEAGSMPFSEYHYPFENKEIFQSRLPAQFVAEYIAQTRAWFYVMHVVSLILFGKAPFENVVTTGTILAEDGSKMSKSKNNFPDPWEVIEKYGVDSLRFYLMNSPVMQADNLNFNVKDLETIYRKVFLILWNVLKYYQIYSDGKGGNLSQSALAQLEAELSNGVNPRKSALVLDKWIEARTQELANSVSNSLDLYDTVRATREIAKYIDDLSTWYLRRSRGRDDEAFFETLRESLQTTSQVVAPFMPYLAEMIYIDLKVYNSNLKIESVHLADWPKVNEITEGQARLLRDMEAVREIASAGLAARQELKISARQPLAMMRVKSEKRKAISGELLKILKDELNVKDIVFDESVKREVELDVNITDKLKMEGLARNLERFIQETRKRKGFKVGDMAALVYETDDEELKAAIGSIDKKKTYLTSTKLGKISAEAGTYQIDGKIVKLTITR